MIPIYTRAFIRAMAMIDNYFKENVKSRVNMQVPNNDSVIKWICPLYLYVKINFDGSVANFVAAGGFIIKSWSSKPIIASVMRLGFTIINVAEAMAMIEALIWTRRRNLTHVCVEGNSKPRF